jgi:hypothetical protein
MKTNAVNCLAFTERVFYRSRKQSLRFFLAAVALCLGAAVVARANNTPVEVPANGLGPLGTHSDMPGRADTLDEDFSGSSWVISGWNSLNPSNLLPTPTSIGDDMVTSSLANPIGLSGYDYAVVHYDAGSGGSASGGEEFFYLEGATSWTFPQNGTGTNGYGGISSVSLYEGQAPVPDAGATMLMLGAALAGLGMMRRKRDDETVAS